MHGLKKLIFACFVTLFTACHPIIDKPVSEPLFRFNLGTEPPTLDPAKCSDLVSMTVLNNTLQGLVKYNAHGNIAPAVAKSWKIDPHHINYHFQLNPQAKWADGSPVTAQDFIAAWKRVLDPKIGSPYAFLLFPIRNAKAFYDQKITQPEELGIKALNAHELEIHLEKPCPFWLDILAFVTTYPVQSEEKRVHANPTFETVNDLQSNGPYQVSQWKHDEELVLTPNLYFDEAAKTRPTIQILMMSDAGLSLAMYENHELDFVETPTSLPFKEVRRIKNRSDYQHLLLAATSFVGFNTQKKPFDNPLVRQAFTQSIDRTAFEKVFQADIFPSPTWIPKGLLGYQEEIGLPFNPQKAQQLLQKAGYDKKHPFPSISFWYPNTAPEVRQMAELLQAQWKEHLGVSVQLHQAEWKVYLQQLQTNPPPLYRLQWYVDYLDPDSMMTVFHHSSGNNYTHWTSLEYDRWIEQAAQATHPAVRQKYYTLAQKKLLEQDTVIAPLYQIPKSYLLSSCYSGVVLNPLNILSLADLKRKPHCEPR